MSVTLIYEDNNWKIDSFQQSAIDDLALTEDESGWLMQESGYGRSKFDGERNIEGFDTVYVYQLLDKNRIVGVVKHTGFIMEALTVTQRDWIVYRDHKAEKGTDQLGGGWQSLQRMINLGDITKDRCYELVEEYL